MRSLLHLDSSAGDPGESVSRQLTALFADTWWELYPGAGYRPLRRHAARVGQTRQS